MPLPFLPYQFFVPQTSYLIDFNTKVLGETQQVDYTLPYPGKVLPGTIFWPLKVVRDRTWLTLTTNPERKAELLLLFADKRLASSKLLYNQGNYSEGYSVLTKAEKYLEEAYLKTESNLREGRDTKVFFKTLASAALKHYEVTSSIVDMSPEEMKPTVIGVQRYSKYIYDRSAQTVAGQGDSPPVNPYKWN